jgi:tRNA1(Val) A37 N6-methylase TrmN6
MAKNKSGTTNNNLLGGRLRFRQSACGHRAGTDALLLAAMTPPGASGIILDIGAGAGAVGLVAALRSPQAQIGLVDIDATACMLAHDNIRANELEPRMRVFRADILTPASRRAAGLCDEQAALVLTNPPFFDPDLVRVSPDSDRARAHVCVAPLSAWVRACLALLAPGGIFAMIHRADALADCLSSIGSRLGGVSIRPVHPRAEASALRILVRGVKGSKAPLRLEPPLVLHEEGGRFTPEALRVGFDLSLKIFSDDPS